MRIEKCSFCGAPCYPGHCIMYARNDAKVFRFCGPKCNTRFKKKMNPLKTRWTKAFRRSRGKEMVNDRTLAFEKRRNVPVKYNRELVAKTLQVMQRVQEIKERREKAFYAERMKVKVECETQADLKMVAQHLEWIPDGKRATVKKEMVAAHKFLNRLRHQRRMKRKLLQQEEL
eukprot:RCo033116